MSSLVVVLLVPFIPQGLEVMVLIPHGQERQLKPYLPQKVVVVLVLAVLVVAMEAVAEVMVPEITTVRQAAAVVQKFKLVNQAIAEHTDLDIMVVMVPHTGRVLAGYIVLAEAAVLVVLEQA
jgi:hypothetical protein